MMYRLFDFFLAFVGLVLLLPVLILVYIIGLFDTGAPIFRQTRVGRNKKPFVLIKFRTMSVDTRSVASHLVDASSVTSFGGFLRKTKLDELPQLLNVLKGEMSLVGPRPNLFNQEELIDARDRLDAYAVRPGITGLAQINNIDMSDAERLAEVDKNMIDTLTIRKYFTYILFTAIGKGTGDRVRY